MTDANDEPDWQCLPHDPQAFFTLEDGYDRKDLKRKYNALIRRYKPEKAPAEFQRIRAAFEVLDNQLRYGQRLEMSLRPQFDASWANARGAGSPDKRAVATTAQEAAPADTAPPSLSERLETESPDAILKELLAKENKTPYDYYAIGLIADTRSDRKAGTFLTWLLKGLQQHPRDPALYALLYQYMRRDIPLKQVPKLLLQLAKVVNDDRFYSLSEPLWDILLKQTQFAEFAKVLNACESQLSDFRIAAKLAFYIHILKTAVWQAPDSWVDRTFTFVEENFRELPPMLEVDVDLINALRDYIRTRADFLDGDPVRKHIDNIIFVYCSEDDQTAEREFLQFQIGLASGQIDVLDAFDEADTIEDPWFQLWTWIDADMSSRLGIVDENAKIKKKSVIRLLNEIERKSASTSSGQLYSYIGILFLFSRAIPIIVSTLGIAWPVSYYLRLDWPKTIVLGCVAILPAVFISKFANQKLVIPFWQSVHGTLQKRCYRKTWRRQLLVYLERTNIPLMNLLRTIYALEGESEVIRPGVINCSYADMGLITTSMAYKFMV